MSYFCYRAIRPAEDPVPGEVEMPSRQEVVGRVQCPGQATGRCEIATFFRRFAVLVGAGLPLKAALQAPWDDVGKALAWFVGAVGSSIAARARHAAQFWSTSLASGLVAWWEPHGRLCSLSSAWPR
jgi:hypothetical protein